MTTTIKTSLLAATLLAGAATPVLADTLQFWTTEEQPERLEVQREIAARFTAQTGVEVDVIPVTETDLGTRATAAYAAGTLPDVIYHTLQYVLPWSEAGILDTLASSDVVESLDASTFAPAALNIADFNGDYAAVPMDGWTQMVVYRKDLFEQHGLSVPDSYADIEAAIEVLHNPPSMYGFVAATKVDENFMSQVLEHVFLANGVSPVSEDGFKPLEKDATIEVLDFYKTLAEASPPGELYWKQSRELYFAGKAAMIIWSPFILDELGGLRDSAPPTISEDPTSTELAGKTGIVTTLSGPSNPEGAAWSDIRYLGITADADIDNAIDFVEFTMTEGYLDSLGMAAEGKFPVRRGEPGNPDKFMKGWSQLPVGVDRKATLTDLYDEEVIENLVSGLDSASRWGVKENQLSLASKMINSQVINRLVREYIDGVRSAEATVDKLNEELSKIQ